MDDIQKFIGSETLSVSEAMQKIDRNSYGILFLVNNPEEERLTACITDGDIRRYLLRGGKMDGAAKEAANHNPKFAYNLTEAKQLYDRRNCIAIPILDEKTDRIVDIYNGNGVRKKSALNIPVVINAGGRGTRLDPFTRVLPKPLIPVGELPIIELIMKEYQSYACTDFHIIVNYKRELIKAYFSSDNSTAVASVPSVQSVPTATLASSQLPKLSENSDNKKGADRYTDRNAGIVLNTVADSAVDVGYKITWYDEEKPLGTGGGLSLLRNRFKGTFFFANCDALLTANYESMVRFHKENKNVITMICSYKNVNIPYGVVDMGVNGAFEGIKEKPLVSFLTNTGIYIVEPEVIDDVKDNEVIGFPDIVERERSLGKKVGVFPVSENDWMDMGQLPELEKMRARLYGE